MFGLGPSELVIVGIVAIMLFGKRLPEVAAKFGKSYREFRRGLTDIQSKIDITGEFTDDSSSSRSKPRKPKTYSDYDDRDEVSAPKFEPPPAPPEAST